MSRALLQKELDGQIASIYADREREYIVQVDLLELSWRTSPSLLHNVLPVTAAGIASHTRTVMRECCKGDDQSQWRRANFDPPPPLNPLTDLHQNLHRSLSRGYLPPCKISFRSDKGFRFRACATSCTNVYSAIFWGSKAPFTRYNLLTNRLSNRFDNRLIVNRFDNRLYRVNGV